MEAKAISRRAALAAAGLAAAGLAGCAAQGKGQQEDPSWSGGYLPIGSTVRLDGAPEGMEHVVVARRVDHDGSGTVRDYALVPAVYGLMSTLASNMEAVPGEVLFADEGEITQVVAVGSLSEAERRAEGLLSEGRSNGKDAGDLLIPLVDDQKAQLSDGE